MFTLIYLANHLIAVETSENYVERFVVVVSNDGEIKFVCKSISWYFQQNVMFDFAIRLTRYHKSLPSYRLFERYTMTPQLGNTVIETYETRILLRDSLKFENV